MSKNKKITTFAIVFTGLMIAISVMLKLATQYIIIGGAQILRFDLFGPFERLPGIFFGPVVGGICGVLIDLLGYLFANKSVNGYMFPLTITAFLNVFLFVVLWNRIKRFSQKTVEIFYLVLICFIGILGCSNLFLSTSYSHTSLGSFINSFGENSIILTYTLIAVFIIGILLYLLNKIIIHKTNLKTIEEHYFKLFLANLLPNILITTVNTAILMIFITSLQGTSFFIFLIPRLAGMIISVIFNAYVLAILYDVSKKHISQLNLR